MSGLVKEQIAVRNRWTKAIQFEAEIECRPDATIGVKLGLAVKWARRNDADLRHAYLCGADLSGVYLRDADLRDANLRDANLRDANLCDADLSGAVLIGADLRDVDLRDADLSDADLRGAFLRHADLSGAILRHADLSGAVLIGASLRDVDLRDANLRDANLCDADLRGAVLSDCPVKIENIHQAVFNAASQPDALDMGRWHCGTTHCRAGWVVTLAGESGKALESAMGTPAAAALIYQASDPSLERIPNFYDTNEGALKDMKRLALAERKKGGAL